MIAVDESCFTHPAGTRIIFAEIHLMYVKEHENFRKRQHNFNQHGDVANLQISRNVNVTESTKSIKPH